MDTQLTEIEQFIDKIGADRNQVEHYPHAPSPVMAEAVGEKNPLLAGELSQWLALGNDKFLPASVTVPKLPVGVYRLEHTPLGIVFCRFNLVTDELMQFPESRSADVLKGIRKFWDAKDRFRALGQLHKRGVILWGPPGSGKTGTVALLIRDIVEAGGMVLVVDSPGLASEALKILRRIEPGRPLICVMEDLDELVRGHSESGFLSLLDGENQVDNVCHIATTNYPERLDPRFVNRPSRFDEVIKIDMPNSQTRRIYLRSRLNAEQLNEFQLAQWVDDTEDMSLAHLKELMISVFCLDADYGSVLARLKAMKRMKFVEGSFGFNRGTKLVGYGNSKAAEIPAQTYGGN